MSTPDHTEGGRALDDLTAAVNETLLLAVETLGLRTAVRIRSEVQAVAGVPGGRLVVAGESDQGSRELIAGLVGLPDLVPVLRALPRVHTTFRFAPSPTLLVTTTRGEQELVLGPEGDEFAAPPQEFLAGLAGRPFQLDVRLASPVLSRFSVVHLPDLHTPGERTRPLLSLTKGTTLLYVKTASAPLSAVELAFLAAASGCAGRCALVLTKADRYPSWAEVAAANNELVAGLAFGPERSAPWPVVVSEDDPAAGLRPWLMSHGVIAGVSPLGETIELTGNLASAVRESVQAPAADAAINRAADELRYAEEYAARVSREAMTWLPRLGFEFTRLRSELGERVAKSLTQLEQRHEQWIQVDVADATARLPEHLLQDLRALERTVGLELSARLEGVSHRFLSGRSDEFMPDRAHTLAAADHGVALVGVSQVRTDQRTELFASLGNFGSGRQSISLVSSVATAVAVPAALVGAVIGLGFWRLGRRSRQDGVSRVQASRWLKVQLSDAGRVLRYGLDQSLNQAQLAMNLAVRDYHDRLGVEARQSLENARKLVAEAESTGRAEADRAASRTERAQQVQERCLRLAEAVSSGA